MFDSMRLYGRYLAISIRSQMQYRASFLMMAFGNFLITAIEFVGIWALFARFGSLRAWTLPEVALFYGIINIAFGLSEGLARGFDLCAGMVKRGEFDRVLLRPRSTLSRSIVLGFGGCSRLWCRSPASTTFRPTRSSGARMSWAALPWCTGSRPLSASFFSWSRLRSGVSVCDTTRPRGVKDERRQVAIEGWL